jgi:hypothetical protein
VFDGDFVILISYDRNLRCDPSDYIAHIHILQLISCFHQTESQMYVDLAQPPFCSLHFLTQQEDPDIVTKLIVAFDNFPVALINYFPCGESKHDSLVFQPVASSLHRLKYPTSIYFIRLLSSNNIIFYDRCGNRGRLDGRANKF